MVTFHMCLLNDYKKDKYCFSLYFTEQKKSTSGVAWGYLTPPLKGEHTGEMSIDTCEVFHEYDHGSLPCRFVMELSSP